MVQQFQVEHKGYALDADASSARESEEGLHEVERDLGASSVPPARNLDAVVPQVGWSKPSRSCTNSPPGISRCSHAGSAMSNLKADCFASYTSHPLKDNHYRSLGFKMEG
jgi:hypothetical protein